MAGTTLLLGHMRKMVRVVQQGPAELDVTSECRDKVAYRIFELAKLPGRCCCICLGLKSAASKQTIASLSAQ
jgi:hypothetical protein